MGRSDSLSKFKSGREGMNKTGLKYKSYNMGPNDLQEADRRGAV